MYSPLKFGFFAALFIAFVTGFGLFIADKIENSELEVITPALASEVVAVIPPELLPIDLPFGGKSLDPYRFIALYGNPDIPALGALGEQDIDKSIERLTTLTAQYQGLSNEQIIPTVEIIATIASAGPTENNDYSQELDIAKLKPWILEAKQRNMYVVLDLQPGRTSFLEQAMQYEELLKQPHVGLALDPEWRLLSEQARHLSTIGSVSAEEINQTSTWLADLVKDNKLPQKLFIVHQFKPSMIIARENMQANRVELKYIIHADGHGNMGQKIDTYTNTQKNLPANISMGWKNFYDEDKPTPTPEQTMSQTPNPVFISYQ